MSADGIVDEIKSRMDIVELISEYVPMRRAGQNYKGLCPFHAEKTPSFMVSSEKQIFHCFGCGAGGDVFGFLMRHDNLEFREALEVLAKRAGVELQQRSPVERGLKDRLKAAQAEALAFWKDCLKKNAPAKEYLKKRGITGASVEKFSLGYAPPGWHTLLDLLRRKGYDEEAVVKAGLAARGNRGPYDIFRARIIFPIFDLHGEPVAFGGRVLDDGTPKYLNSPDTMLFKKGETLYALGPAREEIRKKGYSVVVEGYLDAIMCHQHGITNVVAPLGTALTQGHLKKLANLADGVLLVFDGDQAGTAAAKRSLGLVLEQGLRGKVLSLPEGKDPDSLLREKGSEYMRKLMSGALTPVEFILGTPGIEGDKRNEAVELISRVSDTLLQADFIRELSDLTATDERSVREAVSRFRKTGNHQGARLQALAYDKEILLLSAAIAAPEKTEEIFRKIELEDITSSLARGIFDKLLREKPLSSDRVYDAVETEEERTLITRLTLAPGFEPEDIDRNIDDCIRRINTRRLDEKIRSARTAGDLELLTRLYSERQKLVQGN